MCTHSLFKKIIILFWTFWWLIALWTDVVGGLVHWHGLQVSWANDDNYVFLVQSLQMYAVPAWVPAVCYFGIMAWSGLSVVLFAWSSVGLGLKNSIWMRRADLAFTVSLSFWLAFFVMDQLLLKFALEQNHMVQGGFELLTYLALYSLPDESAKAPSGT